MALTKVTGSGIGSVSTVATTKLDVNIDTNARLQSATNISEVGSGVFALQVGNQAESALKPMGFRAEDIRFATGNAIRARITDNGITFNADTAAANALDDYEEGTWTPAFVANGATFGYSVQKGSYVKIGALVTLWYNITLSSISTSANSVFISGLPFSTYSISDLYAGGGLGAYANINLGTGTTLAYQLPAASGTQIELKEIGDNMGENGVVASELTSTTFIRGSIFYRAA